MNLRRLLFAATMLAALTLAAQAPIAVRWTMGTNGAEKGYYSSRFTITNVSGHDLAPSWQFFFNQFSRSFKLPPQCAVDMEEISTTYYRITPNARCRTLAPGDTIVVDMLMKGTYVNVSYSPMGGHVVLNGDMAHPIAVNIERDELCRPGQWMPRNDYPDGNPIYAFNETVNNVGDAYTGNDYDIFPTPKQVSIENGYTQLGTLVTIKSGGFLGLGGNKAAKALLVDQLKRRGIYVSSGQGTLIRLGVSKKLSDNPEFYSLTVDNGRITIKGASQQGLLNGVKTLVAAIDHSRGRSLQNAHVEDYPDFAYRGFMLDIARNFMQYDELCRFIDLLGYYKIDRFQFHITDDEAWRLEIPGLPELTEVASRRGCTTTEDAFLAQIFDGNGNPNDLTQSANGYLTRAQFVALLKRAALHGIKVIPEIETPGHARAAIYAMKARHARLAATDLAAANHYRLWDDADTSRYYSAQAYTDNVLNVAQEGVYNFVEKVVDELRLMYKDAGLKLDVVHLGGDEVPRGGWDGSPAVKELMRQRNFTTAHQVSEYYIERVATMLQRRGIKIEGWQEVAQNHSDEFNRRMAPLFAGVNTWSTVGSRIEVPYQIANTGYPVILSNVTNFYFDMGYNWHQYEPGLHWGGSVDEFAAWEAQPCNIYRTARTAYDGSPIDLATAADGKEVLRTPNNIIGVQAQIFGETLRNYAQVEYLTLPKLFGLAERAWNARPVWGEDYADNTRYLDERHQFNLKVGVRELPLMERMGHNFRLGQPGIKVVDGMLWANSQYPGEVIRYTLDGSEPNAESPQWTKPVPVGQAKLVKACVYYLGHRSVTTYLFNE